MHYYAGYVDSLPVYTGTKRPRSWTMDTSNSSRKKKATREVKGERRQRRAPDAFLGRQQQRPIPGSTEDLGRKQSTWPRFQVHQPSGQGSEASHVWDRNLAALAGAETWKLVPQPPHKHDMSRTRRCMIIHRRYRVLRTPWYMYIITEHGKLGRISKPAAEGKLGRQDIFLKQSNPRHLAGSSYRRVVAMEKAIV